MTATGRPSAADRSAVGWSGGASAVVLAVLVVLCWLALVAGWVYLLLVDRGWSRVFWAAFGVLVLWYLRPRPARVRPQAIPVTEHEAPGLHALVAAVSDAAGVRAPRRVLLDTTYPVAAQPVGYGGRVDLVVGLPQWTVLDPRERVAVLAMALGGPASAEGVTARVVRFADDLLAAGREVLAPPGTVPGDLYATTYAVAHPVTDSDPERVARGIIHGVGAAGMAVVDSPLRLAQAALHRLWRPAVASVVLRADARAAALAGRDAVAAVLRSALWPPLGLTAAARAARSGDDPFTALARARRPERSEYHARLAAESAASPGPVLATADRLEAVERSLPTPGLTVDPGLAVRADADVARLRPEFIARLTDELRAADG